MKKKFSIRARGNSFVFAFEGLKDFFKAEHNAVLHLAGTLLLVCLVIFFRVTGLELVALTVAAGLVWMAELFNTAIEKIMDFVSMERKPAVKVIKDLSAAAVLTAAITAVITGCIIFIPKLS